MSNLSTKFLRSTALKLRRLPQAYAADRKGVAAIEFALIAPIMIAFYFGLSEVSMMISADRNVAHAASVVGDLATQSITLDEEGVEDVMTASLAVLGIKSSDRSKVTIELNSYVKENDGSITTVGYARLGPPISAGGPAKYNPKGLNNNMLNTTSGVVVARINYTYKPVTLEFAKKVTLNETFILKPRKSLSVPFDEGGTTTFSCSANADLSVTC